MEQPDKNIVYTSPEQQQVVCIERKGPGHPDILPPGGDILE
jgi:S-adenosylmethionine synthetase